MAYNHVDKLRCTFFHMPPFTFVNKTDISLSYGMMIEIMKFLVTSLKVGYTIALTREPEHGQEISPGNWTGVLGEFMRNESDIAFVPFAPTPERGRAAAFTTTFWFTYFSSLSGAPRQFVKNAHTYFSTFEPPVWVMLASTYVLMSTSMFLFVKIQSLFKMKSRRHSIADTFFYLFGSIFAQGLPFIQPSTGNRVMTAMWYIGIFSAMTCFSGGFMAKLTLKGTPQKIDSLVDILKYPGLRPLVAKGTVCAHFIKSSSDKNYKKLWLQIEKHKGDVYHGHLFHPHNMVDTHEWKSVIISDYGALLYGVDKTCTEGIEYYFAKEIFLSVPLVLALRKGLPDRFMDEVSYRLIRFSETGHVETLMKRFFPRADKCGPHVHKEIVRPLSLLDVKPLFYLWLMGLLLGTFSFTIEILKAPSNPSAWVIVYRRLMGRMQPT